MTVRYRHPPSYPLPDYHASGWKRLTGAGYRQSFMRHTFSLDSRPVWVNTLRWEVDTHMLIEYSSNNSGGHWWLKDEDWLALEAAGWNVAWEKDKKPDRFGLRGGEERWLGALSTSASKNFETPGDAMREFESITGQKVTDEGCNCCGAPHNFRWGCATSEDCGCPERTPHTNYGSVWGEDCLQYLYPTKRVPHSLREVMESGE